MHISEKLLTGIGLIAFFMYVYTLIILSVVYYALRQEAGPRNGLPALGLKLDSLVQRPQVCMHIKADCMHNMYVRICQANA